MKLLEGEKLSGPAGSATQLLMEYDGKDPVDVVSGTVGAWFLDCPGQSVAWRHYHLSAIHLRDIPGVKPAVIREPGATHEFMMAALDPKLHPVPLDIETWSWLRPMNLCEQVKLPDDDSCKRLLRDCAMFVVMGKLWAEPPLSGQVEPWRKVLRATAEHAWGSHGRPS